MTTSTKIKTKKTSSRVSSGSTTSAKATASPAPTTGSVTDDSLASIVAELTAALDSAETKLGPAPSISTATQKRRTAKPRKGSEKALALLAPIVQQHGLESSSLNTTAMLALNEKAQTLVPLQTHLQKVVKRVANEAFEAQTSAWNMGLQLYSLVQRRAKNDGELATSLEPIGKLFAYRHPSVKAAKPTKTQTRAKADLKKAMALAAKHGVDLGGTSAASNAESSPVATAPSSSSEATPVSVPVSGAVTPTPIAASPPASPSPPSSPAAPSQAPPATSTPAAVPVLVPSH
jgi:hypothetical protein